MNAIVPVSSAPESSELDSRLNKVRAMMQKQKIDYYVSAQTDNVYYLTNFAYFPMERPFFLIIPASDEPTLVLPLLEVSHAEERVLIDVNYRTYREYPAPGGLSHVDALKELIPANARVGIEKLLPVMHREIIPGQIVTTDLIEEIRLVKSEYEISRIAYACKIVEAGLAKIMELSKPGVQQLTLYSEGVRQMMGLIVLEVSQLNLLMTKTLCAVWPGSLSAQPHSVPGLFDSLQAGGPQVTIVTAQADGYSAELERTFFISNIPEASRAPFSAMMEARALAFELIKPGVRAADVDRQVLDLIKARGFGDAILHRTGHGFGITGHEPPWIAMGSENVIAENMVISIEPGIYIPGVGGYRHSDTVLVTKDGCQAITRAPVDLDDLVL
jgi:Xaa-Pro dipeptidase